MRSVMKLHMHVLWHKGAGENPINYAIRDICWASKKYVSSLVFVCGTLFCYVNFETVCELCRHSWLPNICVYGLYLCCKGNKFYILCWAVYVSMCVHLAISSNFRILGTHSCVHVAIVLVFICLVRFDCAKHIETFHEIFLPSKPNRAK